MLKLMKTLGSMKCNVFSLTPATWCSPPIEEKLLHQPMMMPWHSPGSTSKKMSKLELPLISNSLGGVLDYPMMMQQHSPE